MAVTKRPILNIVVALLVLATVVLMCVPCWSYDVIDLEGLVLRDGKIYLANTAGTAMVDSENGNLYAIPDSVNGEGTKEDKGNLIIKSGKKPVGYPAGTTTFELKADYFEIDGKVVGVSEDGALMLDGAVFTTTVVAPNKTYPSTEEVKVGEETVIEKQLVDEVVTEVVKETVTNEDGTTSEVEKTVEKTVQVEKDVAVTKPIMETRPVERLSPPTPVIGDLHVTYTGEIVTLNKRGKAESVLVPVQRVDSTSVMGYIALPHHRDSKLTTQVFEGMYEGYILNGQVLFPIIMFLLGIVSIVVLLFVKRNTTNGLILPIVFSVAGIIIVWANPLTRAAGLAITLPMTALLLATLVVAAFNGNWFDVEGDWRRDPSAKGKIKEIKAAVGKKDLTLLKSYVQSSDPAVRIAALDAIARVGGFNAFHPIVGQLSSSNADVRIAAAEALVTLGDSRGRTYLMHFMEEDPSPEVREAMNNALGKLPSLGA